MTIYTQLEAYLAKHAYSKGQYKGDAPADPDRRGRTHIRVVRRSPSQISIVMHATDIVRCYADEPDTLMLDSNGWHDSPTTREAYWDLGGFRCPLAGLPRIDLSTPRTPSPRPDCSRTAFLGRAWVDGVRVTHDAPHGWEHTELPPIKKFVADREARKRVANYPPFKEFMQTLPVLLEGAARMPSAALFGFGQLMLSDFDDPANWPGIIRRAIFADRSNGSTTPEWARRWVYNHMTSHLRTSVPA